MEAFNKILKASEKISPRDLLNVQNFAHETALHQAVRGNELTMVRRLVATPGCNVSLVDSQGNNPIHNAASLQDPHCLEALITQPINGARSALTQALNTYNYQGETPLHLAVVSGSLECVRRLVEAGADVHQCERKRGANPLHLAAMFGRRDIAAFLIDHTSVTVEAAMFDGNTALHLAAQSRDAELCRLLMRAKADPEARNCLSRRKKSSESEEEEEEEHKEEAEEEEDDSEEDTQGYTPLDYAGDDEEILAILQGEEVEAEREVLVEGGKKEAPQYSALDSGIDISVTDIQSSELACDESQESARELSERTRERLASLLSGNTWQHLALLLDLEFLVPCLAKEVAPAHVLLHPDNMKHHHQNVRGQSYHNYKETPTYERSTAKEQPFSEPRRGTARHMARQNPGVTLPWQFLPHIAHSAATQSLFAALAFARSHILTPSVAAALGSEEFSAGSEAQSTLRAGFPSH
ncbi:Nuclear factor NF-kappa-B p100 subunit [Chionoecetes opilio]|uniref:Nuclear factor NF-kappa-B p100 subunit n=1 Tax=Chionoecetes opilio TaxID=41210 RepID=A0A8J4YEZ5_CHIOP|nr:Nuclear factor NF-kappa-B p100 subunit [Chionoecetes opilio]